MIQALTRAETAASEKIPFNQVEWSTDKQSVRATNPVGHPLDGAASLLALRRCLLTERSKRKKRVASGAGLAT